MEVKIVMTKTLAQVFGVVLLLLGVGGLLMGEGHLFGLLNIDITEDIVHLLSGGLLAYLGFMQRDEGLTRNAVGVLGIVYLLVGLLGFVTPNLFGMVPNGYTVADNLVHLVIGGLFVYSAYVAKPGPVVRT